MFELLGKILAEHADKIPFCMAAFSAVDATEKKVSVNKVRVMETVIGALIISAVVMFAGVPRVIDVMSEKLNAMHAQVQDIKEDVRDLRKDVNDKYRILDQKIDNINRKTH